MPALTRHIGKKKKRRNKSFRVFFKAANVLTSSVFFFIVAVYKYLALTVTILKSLFHFKIADNYFGSASYLVTVQAKLFIKLYSGKPLVSVCCFNFSYLGESCEAN